ncbi:MAG: hypothetical protein AMJ43_03685 [Coxiella sp. DG_40]|nr:MAG: hypothetical protein AMJ43_03685 [Coxiella sp. DG_40]
MNYTYNFTPEFSMPIQLVGNRFTWPEIDSVEDTFLLKLNVEDKRLKKIIPPYLTIKSKDYVSKQYIERHNKGIRYFNISEIAHRIQAGQIIELSSNKLKWNDDIELLIFKSNISESDKVLVIAPHPDDAEIAAYGFYSTHDTYIVNITAGEGGNIDYCQSYSKSSMEQRLMRAKLRILDSITVPLLAGINPQRVINLGYFDSTLKDMYSNPDIVFTSKHTGVSDINIFRRLNLSNLVQSCTGKATWKNLIADLKALLKRVKPSIIVMPHPLLERHSDHCFGSLAVLEALIKSKLKQGQFFFYVMHPIGIPGYPFGPKHSPVTVPPNFRDFAIQYGVYSYQLSRKLQMEKSFAMDNMRDLREAPDHMCSIKKAVKQGLHKKLKRYRHINAWHNYFRKAIRSNELFLTVPYDLGKSLIEIVKSELELCVQ